MGRFCTIGGCALELCTSKILEKRTLTVKEAEAMSISMPSCKGFAYNPTHADDSTVEVNFFATPLDCHYFGGIQTMCFYLQTEEDLRSLVEGFVESKGRALHHPSTSTWLAGDKHLMMAACQKLPALLTHLSPELRGDRDVALAAISTSEAAVEDVHDHLWNDADFVEAMVHRDGMLLERASERLRDNKKTALAAVCQNAYALQYASDWLKSDPDVVRAAVEKRTGAFELASVELRGDRAFVADLVQQKPVLLQYASAELRSNWAFMMSLMERDDSLLQYASDGLRKNKAFITSLVQKGRGEVIRHAHPSMFRDAELILMAMDKDKSVIRHAGRDAWYDREFLKRIVEDSWRHLRHAPVKISDRKIARIAINQDPEAFQFLSDSLKQDPETVYLVYKKNEDVAVKYAHREVFLDRAFCLAIAGKSMPERWSEDVQEIFESLQPDAEKLAKKGQVLTVEIKPSSRGNNIVVDCKTLSGRELQLMKSRTFASDAKLVELRSRIDMQLKLRNSTKRANLAFHHEDGSLVADSDALSAYRIITVKIS